MRGAPRGRNSAGLLLYRRTPSGLEVLLAHPGGPYWVKKDDGAWTIPKGESGPEEDLLAAARREFFEETGQSVTGPARALGSARQPSGKTVHIFASEGDFDTCQLVSATFEMEWPPRTGRIGSFPEIDRAQWFGLDAARAKIIKGQAVFLDRLRDMLDLSARRTQA